MNRSARAIREHVEAMPLRLPPFNIAAVDEARSLARQAERLHRTADDEQDPDRRAALRRQACDLDMRADGLVPVEYRG